MISHPSDIIRNVIIWILLIIFLSICEYYNYLLFHVFVELFAVVIAFSLFTVTWSARKTIDNQYLFFIGVVAVFIGILDTFHVITYQGMNIIESPIFYANQFWIATRFMESLAMLSGFFFLMKKIKIQPEILLASLLIISLLILLSILYWESFPTCYVKDIGQTKFKIYAEYVIIGIIFISLVLLIKNRSFFDRNVFYLLIASFVFAMITEFCFTLYISNFSFSNQLGHYSKLITFYLIYKANVETCFTKPATTIFKNLKESEEKFQLQSIELAQLNNSYVSVNHELKTNLEEINLLYQRLAAKNEKLDELNATKDKFFSIIAHDLKNPFNTLLNLNAVIVNNGSRLSAEKIREINQMMYETTERTYNLLENLLEWAQVQTGKLNPFFRTIKPSELVEIVNLQCEQMANSKDIEIQKDIQFDESILADVEMIKTVLRNLLSNAIKFTDKGGFIIIKTKMFDGTAMFSVTDRGMGIEPKHIDGLFRIDSKLSKPGTANEKGTGLGLILCKEFIDKHGGDIWAESELGKGSTFSFTLPLVQKNT